MPQTTTQAAAVALLLRGVSPGVDFLAGQIATGPCAVGATGSWFWLRPKFTVQAPGMNATPCQWDTCEHIADAREMPERVLILGEAPTGQRESSPYCHSGYFRAITASAAYCSPCEVDATRASTGWPSDAGQQARAPRPCRSPCTASSLS